MADPKVVVELDNIEFMTPEQTLARASRDVYTQVAVMGLDADGYAHVWHSGEDRRLAHWLLAKGADALLAVS